MPRSDLPSQSGLRRGYPVRLATIALGVGDRWRALLVGGFSALELRFGDSQLLLSAQDSAQVRTGSCICVRPAYHTDATTV